MSLVRLLTTGKSLVEIGETPSRYRLARQNWLPKFGSAKNPFATAAAPNHDGEAYQAVAADKVKSPPPGTARKNPERPPASPMQSGEAATPRQGGARVAGEWLAALNPFSSKTGGKSKAVSGARLAAPVQGELSLDNVKVVRNDLSDTDLEIVPLRSATVKTSASLDAVAAARALGEAGPLGCPSAGSPGVAQVR